MGTRSEGAPPEGLGALDPLTEFDTPPAATGYPVPEAHRAHLADLPVSGAGMRVSPGTTVFPPDYPAFGERTPPPLEWPAPAEFPSGAGSAGARPSGARPSEVGPSAVGPSTVGLSAAGPSAAGMPSAALHSALPPSTLPARPTLPPPPRRPEDRHGHSALPPAPRRPEERSAPHWRPEERSEVPPRRPEERSEVPPRRPEERSEVPHWRPEERSEAPHWLPEGPGRLEGFGRPDGLGLPEARGVSEGPAQPERPVHPEGAGRSGGGGPDPVMFLPPSVLDPSPRPAGSGSPGPGAPGAPGAPRLGGAPPPRPVPGRHAAPIKQVDYGAVRALGRQISERLSLWLRNHADASEDDRRRERDRAAGQLVAEWVDAQRRAGVPLASGDERALLEAVIADLVGLGRLQALLADPSIEEVHILGCDRVRITRRSGAVEVGSPIADSDDEMVEILQTAARRAGSTERSLSTSRPVLDLQLPDGSRLAAVYQVSHRPYAVIRRHSTLDVTLPDLAGGRPDLAEMIDPLIGEFLSAAMRAGLNIMVAGLAGAGKTTLLRALAAEIPRQEAFVLLEESRELGLHSSPRHPWAMSFEAREGHGERDFSGRPAGEVTIADLIPLSLRMGVLRVIVGEVRSREIVPMLQAMTTSRGSMCTIHARTPQAVTERIIELSLSHGKDMTVELARRMAGNALDLVVYVTVQDETPIGGRKHRFVSHIEEVDGVTGDRIATTTVFGPGADGRGVPKHLPGRVRDALLRVGYDARALAGWIEAGHGAWRSPLQSLLNRTPTTTAGVMV